MGFKDEFKRELRNIKRDVEKEVHKTWTFDYKGHRIEIINQVKEEQLLIDGITIDRKQRKYLLSHIIPYSKLSGTLELKDGTKHKVTVKLGGYVRLNCIVKIDNQEIYSEAVKLAFLPWDHKEKIVPYIQQQFQMNNKIGDYLPDEEYLYDENSPRLAAGLSDHIVNEVSTPFFPKKLLKLFKEQVNQPTTKTRKATYEAVIYDHIASYGEEFIELLQQAQLDESLVQQEAIWLLEHAAHREVVKFAISVLGCTNCEENKELLSIIGMHEEFTPYVIFALKNGTIQANDQIWRLAQSAHGWGKITAVEQLEARTPEIKQWLLTTGCENSVADEYLAYPCAAKGELDIALYEDTILKDLYDGAGLIILGLLSENAPQGMDEYPHASAVLSRFVHHAQKLCETLEDFYPLMKISEYVHEERFNDQWKRYERTSLQEAIQLFVNDPKWSQLAIEALKKDYNRKALEIARFYENDVTPFLFESLKKNPTNSDLFFAIMETNQRQHIKDLCTFAETHLSLSNLSNDEQDCLLYIIQELYEHEGVGLMLIHAALTSDNGGLQYHALSVLEGWEPSIWQQSDIKESIKEIAATTKDKEDRQLARRLLNR
ncbi:hypothetical protein KHA96_08675 [Bacillus sp. FJAT-49711]|uniref:hypothetical protein n=1 Tax=Bacillus sp. FJAT-49711 TaxID=2833585 RepID=UPI001BC9AD11|nr:hypothetical protein [Bacillus sp. FJAT-49711]MBS4218384.1 hypothetical protein [Bacillus sp. FJAT-49711]